MNFRGSRTCLVDLEEMQGRVARVLHVMTYVEVSVGNIAGSCKVNSPNVAGT